MRTAVLRHHAEPTDFVKNPPGNDRAVARLDARSLGLSQESGLLLWVGRRPHSVVWPRDAHEETPSDGFLSRSWKYLGAEKTELTEEARQIVGCGRFR
jgi:hypothetical protein